MKEPEIINRLENLELKVDNKLLNLRNWILAGIVGGAGFSSWAAWHLSQDHHILKTVAEKVASMESAKEAHDSRERIDSKPLAKIP